jgi:kynurenine formamidase
VFQQIRWREIEEGQMSTSGLYMHMHTSTHTQEKLVFERNGGGWFSRQDLEVSLFRLHLFVPELTSR